MTDLFSEAIALHRAGRLDEAETRYKAILDSSPGHADSLNLLGVIAHQRGDNGSAVDFIKRAISLRADRHAYYCNLSAAYCSLGRYEEAAEAARVAAAIRPDQPEAYVSLGLAHQGAKRWAEAENTYREISSRWPRDPRGAISLGDCFREQERVGDAIAAYRDALTRDPNLGAVHLVVGSLLLAHDGPAAAEPNLHRAVDLMPGEFAALVNYGASLAGLGREQEALRFYECALKLSADDCSLRVNIGQALLGLGNHADAEKWFTRVLDREPENAQALCGLADSYRESDREEDSIALYERSLQREKSYEAYRGLADAQSETGQTARAESVLREAVRLYPSRAEGHVRLGTLLASNGDLEGAEEAFRAGLRAQPGFPQALAELAGLLRGRLPEADRIALASATRNAGSPVTLAGVYFGLAQVEDACGNYAAAADRLRQAHEFAEKYQSSHGRPFDANEAVRETDRLIQAFNADRLRSAQSGEPSDQPVFVVGMPRSGTTLVEQILASHSKVFGAGELKFARRSLMRLPKDLAISLDPIDAMGQVTPAAVRAQARWYLDQIAKLDGGSAERVVDKMPENYLLLGWIAMMFPRARIIHCRRDLRDIGLSCWMTEFRAVNWANNQHSLAVRIQNYARLMRHWREVLPIAILDVDYEQLVTEQESESRRMIDWLGLDWEPACLDFHRTRRTVQTPSATQVRQPIHSRSVGRWRNYREALRLLLEEFALETAKTDDPSPGRLEKHD